MKFFWSILAVYLFTMTSCNLPKRTQCSSCTESAYYLQFDGDGKMIGAPPNFMKAASGRTLQAFMDPRGKEVEAAVLPLYNKVRQAYYTLLDISNRQKLAALLHDTTVTRLELEYRYWLIKVQEKFPYLFPGLNVIQGTVPPGFAFRMIPSPDAVLDNLIELRVVQILQCGLQTTCSSTHPFKYDADKCRFETNSINIDNCATQIRYEVIVKNAESLMLMKSLNMGLGITTIAQSYNSDRAELTAGKEQAAKLADTVKKRIDEITKLSGPVTPEVCQKFQKESTAFQKSASEIITRSEEIRKRFIILRTALFWYTGGLIVKKPEGPSQAQAPDCKILSCDCYRDSIKAYERLKLIEQRLTLDTGRKITLEEFIKLREEAADAKACLFAQEQEKRIKEKSGKETKTAPLYHERSLYSGALYPTLHNGKKIHMRHHDGTAQFSVMNRPLPEEYREAEQVFVLLENMLENADFSFSGTPFSPVAPFTEDVLVALNGLEKQSSDIKKMLGAKPGKDCDTGTVKGQLKKLHETLDNSLKSMGTLLANMSQIQLPDFFGRDPKKKYFTQVLTPGDSFHAPVKINYRLTSKNSTTSYNFNYRVNKLYRFLPAAGIVYAGEVNPEIGDDQKPILKNYSGLLFTAGIQTHFKKADIRDNKLFRSEDFASAWSLYTGINLKYPLKSFQVGLGLDFVSGLSVTGGANIVRSTQPIFSNNQVVSHKDYLQIAPYGGVLIQPELFTALFKYLTGIPSVSNPETPKN